MAYVIKTLLVSSAIVTLITFGGCTENRILWNDVNTYFGKRDLTGDDIRKKVSFEAINSITNGDTTNFTVKVRDFFVRLGKSPNYGLEKRDSLIYVIFNKNDEIAAGPTVEIRSDGKDWYISDVRFGK
ncbi:hypothetical protein [Flavihumibacter petaseus]|uniref:Uncharacterized protein n=1 Tax=Flavihumibacter petaseus NBRC 106054 TaxID=1220578 RepID=A0A0E9MX93_9BACT|nr:hypothetical protein [Flavihumibacter petaseus]GAO42357.1 hypothetical protein FPE01S_01_13710 [Flavihumibacter petaseus NBRC 106054]